MEVDESERCQTLLELERDKDCFEPEPAQNYSNLQITLLNGKPVRFRVTVGDIGRVKWLGKAYDEEVVSSIPATQNYL